MELEVLVASVALGELAASLALVVLVASMVVRNLLPKTQYSIPSSDPPAAITVIIPIILLCWLS